MRTAQAKSLVFFLAIALLSFSAFAAVLRPTGNSVPGEAIVKIQAGASNQDIADIERQGDVAQDDHLSNVGSGTIWRVRSRSQSTDQLLSSLRSHPKVVFAEPNTSCRRSPRRMIRLTVSSGA